MSYSDTKTQPRPIAEIVREKTNDGELIVDFLVDMVLGKIEGATLWHRLEATRQLQRLGLELPNAVKQAVSTSANGHKPERAPVKPQPEDELADIIREKTDGGKDIVRFLIDAMQGKLEDFKPRHRLAASDRLITRGFDIAPDHSEKVYQGKDNKESCSESCYHWAYAVERWRIDGHNREALEQIYGSEEAASVAIRAAVQLRRDTVELHSHVPDHDFTPIENPEDDPDGKGSYGYEILFASFGDNQAVRVANRAVEKYKKQLAKPSRDPDKPPLPQETLAKPPLPQGEGWGEGKTPIGSTPSNPSFPAESRITQNTPVGEGPKPSRDPEKPPLPQETLAKPPLPQGEGWGEGKTPYTRPPSNPQNPGDSEATHKPSREYGHCRLCSDTEEEVSNPSHYPENPPPPPNGHTSAASDEDESPPGRRPARRRRRRSRLNIHLGPTTEEDPPDDDSRHFRDPDEIRVPLRNLSSKTISLL